MNQKSFNVSKLSALAAGVLMALSAEAAPLYEITEIVPLHLGHDRTIASGVNDIGQVVGTSLSISGGYEASAMRAFMWYEGVTIDLGDLSGAPDFSRATQINNSGWVIGSSGQSGIENEPYPTHPFERAFLWRNGIIENLGYSPGYVSSGTGAVAINDGGQVIGNLAFLWQNGVMQTLYNLPVTGFHVNDINENGQIVGYGSQGGSAVSGVIVQDSMVTFVDNLPDDPNPGVGLRFLANNDLGQIVGHRTSPTGFQTFIYSNGVITDIGTDLTVGDINNSGQLVGSFVKNGISTGFIYEDGILYDLNDLISKELNLHIFEAWDISNTGLIVGEGITTEGYYRGFLLTPLLPPATITIPEPGIHTMLLAGLLLMGLTRRFCHANVNCHRPLLVTNKGGTSAENGILC